MCQLKKFKRAEKIFVESQPGASLYVVMTGRVKIYGTSYQGRSKTFAFLEPGDFFGEMSLIDDEVRSASASALEDAILIMLKADDYRKLMISRPQIAMSVLHTLAHRLRRANKEIEALSFNNVLGRIAQILIELSERYGKKTDEGIRIEMPLSHRELARWQGRPGKSSAVLSRVLKNWVCPNFRQQIHHHRPRQTQKLGLLNHLLFHSISFRKMIEIIRRPGSSPG